MVRLKLNDDEGMMILSDALKRSIYIQLHQPAIIISGCFAAIATVLSFFLISQHLHSYTNPAVSFLVIHLSDTNCAWREIFITFR